MEKILVVDDEKSLREVMSIMLKRAGYAATEAADGEEAGPRSTSSAGTAHRARRCR